MRNTNLGNPEPRLAPTKHYVDIEKQQQQGLKARFFHFPQPLSYVRSSATLKHFPKDLSSYRNALHFIAYEPKIEYDKISTKINVIYKLVGFPTMLDMPGPKATDVRKEVPRLANTFNSGVEKTSFQSLLSLYFDVDLMLSWCQTRSGFPKLVFRTVPCSERVLRSH